MFRRSHAVDHDERAFSYKFPKNNLISQVVFKDVFMSFYLRRTTIIVSTVTSFAAVRAPRAGFGHDAARFARGTAAFHGTPTAWVLQS